MKRAVPTRQRKAFEIWQIVYIDLMTQIMMFFVILWSISQMQAEKKGVTTAVGDTTVHEVTLPGDVLFPSGKTKLTPQGEEVFGKLFKDDTGEVLTFETGGLTKRVLVIHGHTDSDGKKEENYVLGFQRAMTVYKEIQKYGPEIIDHAITATMSRTIITHGSTQMMVCSMLIFGGETLHYFALALTIGILFGIYSSVLVASPIVMYLGVSREDLAKPERKTEAEAVV